MMKHVFKPGNGSKETLVVFHGTGGDENDLDFEVHYRITLP